MIVVAKHSGCALVDKFHDFRQTPIRIGTIADVIAEQHEAFSTVPIRLRETGLEGLPVGVDIGEKRYQHNETPVG